VPRVNAALPCNRCRREILPKSMGVLLWRILRRYFAAPPIRRSPTRHVAIFVPEPILSSFYLNTLKYKGFVPIWTLV
jgi:hypothetical protein